MPTIEYVERQIKRIEGFKIAFLQGGVNVHGNKEGIPSYPYSIAAKDAMTVNDWKNQRFKMAFPGYDVDVFQKDGTRAMGQTLLRNIR